MIGSNITGKIPMLYFFMPWFFYKSGMMFTVRKGRDLLKKDMNKLGRMFIIWSIIGYVCHIFWHLFFYKDLSWRVAIYSPARSFLLSASIPMNGALWFIPILFCVRQLSNYFLKRINPVIIAGIVIVVYYITLLFGIKFMPAWISSTLWGMFCFIMGYYLKDYERRKVIVYTSLLIYISSLFTYIPSGYCVGCSPHLRIIWLIACVCSCIAFNNICRGISEFSSQKIGWRNVFPILRYIGSHSMTYYVGHYILFRITFDSISRIYPEWYSTWQGLGITILVYGIVLTSICIVQDNLKPSKKKQIAFGK